MASCPCGTGEEYESCCKLLLDGGVQPETAERLMRARYTAFAKHRIEYLTGTLHPAKRGTHDERETREWSYNSEWLGLEIVSTSEGLTTDDVGSVEFTARYKVKDQEVQHHEVAEFRRKDGVWYFYDGKVRGGDPIIREDTKVGRNDPCPCGSGKKHKKCCG